MQVQRHNTGLYLCSKTSQARNTEAFLYSPDYVQLLGIKKTRHTYIPAWGTALLTDENQRKCWVVSTWFWTSGQQGWRKTRQCEKCKESLERLNQRPCHQKQENLTACVVASKGNMTDCKIRFLWGASPCDQVYGCENTLHVSRWCCVQSPNLPACLQGSLLNHSSIWAAACFFSDMHICTQIYPLQQL